MVGRKDGKILFHRIYLATANGLTSTTAVEWHLKVNDIEPNVGLTKKLLYHNQHAKNQFSLYTNSGFIRNLKNLKNLEKQSILNINQNNTEKF